MIDRMPMVRNRVRRVIAKPITATAPIRMNDHSRETSGTGGGPGALVNHSKVAKASR